jgi:hypothetical protein
MLTAKSFLFNQDDNFYFYQMMIFAMFESKSVVKIMYTKLIAGEYMAQ